MARDRGVQALATPRLKMVGVVHDPGTLATRARVTLSLDGVERTGMASRLTGTAPWQHVVAEATVDAVQGFAGRLEVTVESVTEISAGSFQVIVVTMTILDPSKRTFELMVGAARLEGDASETTAKAVLDAMNRRVAPLLA